MRRQGSDVLAWFVLTITFDGIELVNAAARMCYFRGCRSASVDSDVATLTPQWLTPTVSALTKEKDL
jgi:hypothetical protein